MLIMCQICSASGAARSRRLNITCDKYNLIHLWIYTKANKYGITHTLGAWG